MKFAVREMTLADRGAWADMRGRLWPAESPQAHLHAIDKMLRSDDAWAYVAETPDGTPAGFAEVSIRSFANGCETQPVPFLEGIWVNEPFRRQGIGRGLIAHIAALMAARGFREIGSDSEIHNVSAHAAHRGWGFFETERVVYFRKPLGSREQA